MSIHNELVNTAIGAESVVLDLGCGNGEYGAIGEIGFHGKMLVGLDIDMELLRKNLHISFPILADAHRLPFRQNSFDAIIVRDVFEHIEHPHIVLQEASRIVKPRGVIIIETPNRLNPICFLSSILSLKTRALLKRLLTHEDKIEGNYETYYKCNTGRKLTRALRKNNFVIKHFAYGDIGMDWLRNPIMKIPLIVFQRMTNFKKLHCLKPIIICMAEKRA